MEISAQQENQIDKPSLTIYAAILWNIFIALASITASIYVIGLPSFFNLGRPVQVFATLVALVPALVAVYSTYHIYQKNPQGRLAAMGLNYVGAVLASLYLLHVWGFYTGMDSMAGAMHENRGWLLGFVLAYAIFWISGRTTEGSASNLWLDKMAVGIGMISMIGLLFFGGILGAAGEVLSTYSQPTAWLVTAAIVIFAVLGWRMYRLGEYFGESPEQRIAWQGWLMLSPNIIGFMLFFAGPLLFSLYLSFTNSPPRQTPEFIDVGNYAELLNLQIRTFSDQGQSGQSVLDPGYVELTTLPLLGDERLVIGADDVNFWIAMKNTLLFSLLLVPLSTIPALGLSIILNSKLSGVKFFRSLYFLPSVAAVVGVGVIWREALYSSTVGYLNYAIAESVDFINSLTGASIADPNIVWLSDQPLIAMVVMAAWQIIGFNTVLYLAGLQGIPNVLYEAAQVDGANQWGQFRHVTLPLLGPTTFFVVITTMINGLQVFNEPYVLFGDPPPEDGLTAVFYLHRRTFQGSNFGYASAVAWLLFIAIFVITLIQFRVQRTNPYGR